MDTKLKKSSKGEWIFLSVWWIIFLAFFIMLLTEYNFSTGTILGGRSLADIFSEFQMTGTLAGVLWLAALIIFTSKHLKSHSLSLVVKEAPIDKLCPELLVVGIIGTVVFIWMILPDMHPIEALVAWVNPAPRIAGYVIAVLLCATLLYMGVVLLIRKKVLKMLRSTSLFIMRYERYKNQTPLELRLNRHDRGYRIFLYGLLILEGVMAGIELSEGRLTGAWWRIILIGILVVLCVHNTTAKKLISDMGRLAEEIQKLSGGIEEREGLELPEKSLLYEASCNLFEIKKKMNESVEKRVQSERMKIDLITNVSHDLKTPLTSMIGYTELLKKEELNPAARDYVDIISDKQEKLADMIQDIFELSKASSNSEKLNIEVLDMNKLIEQIMTDMEDVLTGCEFTYVKKLSEAPLLFRGDNAKMYRVVQNILENTVKYSLAHTRVFVETEAVDGIVKLRVKNTASYEMDFNSEEIVERFTRGDKARTSEGHGLGLAIASSLLDNMNGRLHVETDGDVFKVTIELEGIPDNDMAQPHRSGSAADEQE